MLAPAASEPFDFQRSIVAAMPKLKAFAISLCRCPQLADDLVQETMLRAIEHERQFAPGTNLDGWLFTILRNRFLSERRKLAREVEGPDHEIAAGVAVFVDSAEQIDNEETFAILDRLPQNDRDLLFDIAEGMKYQDAADAHGLNVGTVKSRIGRLRELISDARGEVERRVIIEDIPVNDDGVRAIDPAPFLLQAKPIALSEIGDRPVLAWLAIEKLRIDPAYQRDILKNGRRNILAIAGAFDWAKFGTVIVSPRSDGTYALVDGQHRTTAASIVGVRAVPCQIIKADAAKCAAVFAAVNGAVTKTTPLQMHQARLAANDGKADALDRACKAAGVEILRYPVPASKMKPGQALCVGALSSCLARYGEVVLVAALSCITKTRAGNTGLIRDQLVKALCQVLARDPKLVAAPKRMLALAGKIDFARLYLDASIDAKRERRPVTTLLAERLLALFSKKVSA